MPSPAAVPSLASTSTPGPVIKEEPVDPLQMDMDEDDIEYEPDRLNDQFEVCRAGNIILTIYP